MNMKKEDNHTLLADVERGFRFLHTFGMQSKIDLVDLNERVLALIETLISSGHLDLRAFEERRAKMAQREAERMNREGHVHVLLNDVADKYLLTNLPIIDCHNRLPSCKARCCTLGFPLSVQDLDEHVVKWDYGRPYHIRLSEDAYCVHNDSTGRICRIYDQRPAVCRSYDCRKDERIWKDFDRGIIAEQESRDRKGGE
jgi:Fe-S-cluster containining protein